MKYKFEFFLSTAQMPKDKSSWNTRVLSFTALKSEYGVMEVSGFDFERDTSR